MRAPLYILIPVGAVILTGVIGVSIGLLNLAIREAFDSALGPVIFAGGLTVLIMAVAAYMSTKAPDPPRVESVSSNTLPSPVRNHGTLVIKSAARSEPCTARTATAPVRGSGRTEAP